VVYSADTGASHLAGQLDPVAYNIVRTETQRMMDERTGSKIHYKKIEFDGFRTKNKKTDFVRKRISYKNEIGTKFFFFVRNSFFCTKSVFVRNRRTQKSSSERIENYLESEVSRMRAEGVRPIEIENEKLKIINDFKANDFFYTPSRISQ